MEISQHWRLKDKRLRLEGEACPICGAITFPAKGVCYSCVVGNKEQQVEESEKRQIGAMLLMTRTDERGNELVWLHRDTVKTEGVFDQVPQKVNRRKRWAPVGGGIQEDDESVVAGLAREAAEEIWGDEKKTEGLRNWLDENVQLVSPHPFIVNQVNKNGVDVDQFAVSVWRVEVEDPDMIKDLSERGVWVPANKVAAAQDFVHSNPAVEGYKSYKFRPHALVAVAFLAMPMSEDEIIALNKEAIQVGHEQCEALGGSLNNGVWNPDGTVGSWVPHEERVVLGLEY